ncbi:MAG: 3-deoxy-7-phosphoheptulonate synthase [Subdoligranulum variabile]|nr:3-deoxy-7-phosphoheptulonate synthase [Subdoligranulum variabile]
MIIVLKQHAPAEQVKSFCTELEGMGYQINDSVGSDTHILGLIGDTKALAESWVLANPVVETCRRVTEPYKKANRKFHPDDTIVDVGGHKIGGGYFAVMSGPCSVESKEQITYVAQRVQAAGASILRGGAFKPRTSPYSFQGLRAEGLELLQEARAVTGQPIVTELMNNEHIPLFEDAHVDMIQIGARNMQNFELLKAVGRLKTPVLLKRGLSSTLEELVMSAEYIMAEGNPNVVLCERGIRAFETSMRNTLDISAVPMLKKMTHLPVVIDPSHAAGIAFMVPALAQAAVAVGADGLMIETHNNPAKAKSDGAQSLTPDQFDQLMSVIKPELEFFGKKLN